MTIKLLNDLKFADKLNSCEAVTESGKQCLKNYRGYMFEHAATYNLVNAFVQEARSYTFDKGLTSIAESVAKFINENNVSWRLATVCENISNNNSSYNNLAKLSLPTVDKLLEMNEANVVSYIKSGALKDVTYIPEFRSIIKDVYKNQIVESASTMAFNMITPVSYAYVSESKDKYFQVYGKTFCISEGKAVESTCNDADFIRINAHLANFTKIGESLTYEFKPTMYTNDTYKFEIVSESEDDCKLVLTKGNKINESFKTPASFLQYADTASRIMSTNEAKQFMSICGAIADVFEHMDNVVEIDEAKLFFGSNGTVSAVIECATGVNFTKFRSYGNAEVSGIYESTAEAIKMMEAQTGVSAQTIYEARIVEEMKNARPEDTIKIEEELAKESRLRKIQQLAESMKNDPAAIALLNSLARELKDI